MKPVLKSKIVLLGLLLVVAPVIKVALHGWAWDSAHYLLAADAIVGAVIAYLRAAMPDVVTGVMALDRDNYQQPVKP